MDRSRCDDSAWLSGLTLAERVAGLRAHPSAAAGDGFDPARAARRLTRWREQKGFAGDDAAFARRLVGEDVTLDELTRLLGEPPDALGARLDEAPVWLAALSEALAAPERAPERLPLPASLAKHPMAEMLGAAAPMVRAGRERLRQGAEAILAGRAARPVEPASFDALCVPGLSAQLLLILARTMVLELHVARLEGRLAGETPEARFQSFVAGLGRRETLEALLLEYPVMARQLVAAVEAWVTVSLELLERLAADLDRLRDELGGGREPGALVALQSEAGDRHRGGRAVMLLTFASGLGVAYKPKPLAVDAHFQELLAFCNERGHTPPFRVLRVVDRGAYGWTELVARQACPDAGAVHRFYERQGGYLALFYLLLATDGHFENIVPAGEHPMVVDLETLFHPHFMAVPGGGHTAEEVAYTSVLRSGLLPSRGWATDASAGIDLSGLGSSAGQLSPRPSQYWADAGTDQMRSDRKRLEIPGGTNRPTLAGAEVDVLAYVEPIAAGFAHTYRLLASHREELLRFLVRFGDDPVRVILRPTHLYTLLLRESFHPDMLRDALDRDRFFDRLWVPVDAIPYLERVIPAERASLWQGDVPMFMTRPTSRDVVGPGGERVADIFDHSGMELVTRRIAGLGEDDLARQVWFIRASFSTVAMEGVGAQVPSHALPEAAPPLDRARLLAAATAIGDRLEALALRGDDGVSWIGLAAIQERSWAAVPLGVDLYSGVAGIALFLAHLGALTGEARFTATARAAARTIRARAAAGEPRLRSIGGFTGWGGIIHALTHLGALWGDADLLAATDGAVARLAELVADDRSLDLLGGATGAVTALLGLQRVAPSARALAVAVRCGDHLVEKAVVAGRGLGWATRVADRPLPGLAHGAAGAALALGALFAATGEARFRETALAALAFEDDLLVSAPWPGDRATWCYGAAGIGLGRLLTREHLEVPGAEGTLAAAVERTLAGGFGGSHCLCHGDLGSLDFLLRAGAPRDLVQPRAAAVLASVEALGPRSGTPLGIETPGLMAGLAGVGYGLLRLAEPGRVPSILALELPKERA